METLKLGIFEECKDNVELELKIASEFEAKIEDVQKYDYLIAYVDYGSYEGTGYILMREKQTGALFENHSGHCSCMGNEGQFEPEAAKLEYLQSDKFSCYCYGDEEKQIKKYLKTLTP